MARSKVCGSLDRSSYSEKDVAFAPDGRLLVADTIRGNILVWSPDQGLEGHIQGDFGSDIAFSPDGQLIASSSGESVRLSNAQTGRAYSALEGHWGSIMKFAFSSDGQLLASTADDETIRIWNINAGSTCATSDAH